MVDVLVIGAGGAGLVAALSAKENGASVRVLTKTYPTRSQTCMAQGGINAAFSKDDSIQAHYENTLRSAHGLADEKMVRKLCEEGVDAVQWLDRIGVPFSRAEDGSIAQRRLGGASAARACYAQDYTGLKILHTLYDQCNAQDIEIQSEKLLLELLVQEDAVCGARVLDIKTGEVENHYVKSVILATGGYAQLYGKYATNASGSTGDGVIAALNAGAVVSDMEFIQFHPTGLQNSSILISESARGEGGYLLNSKGERFCDELAPRDEVSRAIAREMQKSGQVYIDIRHLGEEFIQHNLPQERKLAKLYENVDPALELVPIKPVAHYTMGGVDVDENAQTNIKGLFAVGECANQKVHGANRLGGNSLLELIVFGRSAGRFAALHVREKMFTCKQKEKSSFYLIDTIKSESSKDFYLLKEQLNELFYTKVSLMRDEVELQEALEFVLSLEQAFDALGVKDRSHIYNSELVEFLEFKNLVALGKMCVLGALNRKESRGAHFREDMQESNELFAYNTIYLKQGDELCITMKS